MLLFLPVFISFLHISRLNGFILPNTNLIYAQTNSIFKLNSGIPQNVSPKKFIPVSTFRCGELSTAPDNSDWMSFFAQLNQFKEKHGHSNVPLGSDLGKWVYRQRRLQQQQLLHPERKNNLESIDFNWDFSTQGVAWDDMVIKLERYKESHGDCFVPKKFIPDPILGLWVSEQRTAKRERRLTKDQIASLEIIGFSWQPKKQCGSKFMIGLRKLEIFRDDFGHCNVPEEYTKDPELWKFVAAQRLAKAKGKLSEKRIAYLDGMDFEWDVL